MFRFLKKGNLESVQGLDKGQLYERILQVDKGTRQKIKIYMHILKYNFFDMYNEIEFNLLI